jgi:pSer/pThr/pTyr-binding forkhead associated (FHA) protein
VLQGNEAAVEVRHLLRVEDPSGHEEVIELGFEPVTMGRARDSTIVIHDTQASRNHARIERDGDGYVVLDCGSKNGTLLNDERVDRDKLEHGDVVHIGQTAIRYRSIEPSRREDGDADTSPKLPDIVAIPEPGTLGALARFASIVSSARADVESLESLAGKLLALVECDRATIVLARRDRPAPARSFQHADESAEGAEQVAESVIAAGLTGERALAIRVPRGMEATLGARRHLLLVPLRSRARVFGLVVLERDPLEAPFEDDELTLATAAGAQITTFLRGIM